MNNKLPPIKLPSRVHNLCRSLDVFYQGYNLNYKASDLVKGMYYAMRPECRSNPDWMSQVAHTGREILYPFFSKESENNILKIFNKYINDNNLSKKIDSEDFRGIFRTLKSIYGKLSDLAHHCSNPKEFSKEECSNFSEKEFEELIEKFVLTLDRVLSLQQLYIHKLIDIITQTKPKKSKKKDIEVIIGINLDSKQYFYDKTEEHWLNFLWENGFLDISGAVETYLNGYFPPEIDYIARVAKKKPKSILNIIKDFPVHDSESPQIAIDLILRILVNLPAKCISSLIKKIKEEQWIRMSNNLHALRYKEILTKLNKKEEYESLLEFLSIILSVKSKDEIRNEIEKLKGERGYYFPYICPFYFDDHELSFMKVFDHLVDVNDNFVEKAFSLTVNTLEGVLMTLSDKNANIVFEWDDGGLLWRNDIFSDKLGQVDLREFYSISKLIQTIKLLNDRLNPKAKYLKVYRKVFQLPDSQLSWRLKLYITASNPNIFKEELKDCLFRLFKTKKYNQIILDEYLACLEKGFQYLPKTTKYKYLNRVLEYFSSFNDERGLIYASAILSRIKTNFNKLEFEIKVNGAGFSTNHQDLPKIKTRLGVVRPKGPITQEEFSRLPIETIVDKLRNEWSPQTLSKKNEPRNFLRPINTEGVIKLIKNDLKKRLDSYLVNSSLFFDPEGLHSAYTYGFIEGLVEVIEEGKESKLKDYSGYLIDFLLKIKKYGEHRSFKDQKHDYWNFTWREVHLRLCDLLSKILKKCPEIIDLDKNHVHVLDLINYLLNYPDPNPQDENEKNVRHQGIYRANSSFFIAINSVRGRAFECMVNYVSLKGKIPDEIKEMYKSLLKQENTRSIMFLFGYYFPFFYFKDIKWIKKQIGKIFRKEDFNLFISAWEGYLKGVMDLGLHKDMFFDSVLQKLYEHCVDLTDLPSDREYDLDPREGLAQHLALAYVFFDSFDFGHKLFDKFLNKSDHEQISYFVKKIGLILNYNPPIKSKEKLKRLWDWMLEHYEDKTIFEGFDFWIHPEFFEACWLARRLKKILRKTNGHMEIFRLEESIVELAKKCPEGTLDVIHLFLEGIIKRRNEGYFLIIKKDDSWYEAMKVIYNSNEENKEKCEKVISDLIEKGSRDFWALKQIVD
ncbi:MAG: hypothetical protein H5T45_05540 [Thermoplasmatales archaeon]|nr:hypothetical protein [Thermoplasmatales archaeon]